MATVSPSAASVRANLADVLAFLNDSPTNAPEDYRPGWQTDGFEPTPAEEAWWIGFGLGVSGTDAEPPEGFGLDARSAFQAGYASGYDNFVGGMIEGQEPDWDSMFPDFDPHHPAERVEAFGCVEARRA